MKAITDKVWSDGTNAWDQSTYTAEQLFEIEPSDIGTSDCNHRGQGHTTYTFHASDVGRVIARYTDKSDWTCWVFSSKAVQS